MTSFEQGDVIKVPFPYTSRPARQWRPALVVSVGATGDSLGLLWVVMITSAENRGWNGDVPVTALATAGLPAPSVVRTSKIATIESGDATRLGKVSVAVRGKVMSLVARRLGVATDSMSSY